MISTDTMDEDTSMGHASLRSKKQNPFQFIFTFVVIAGAIIQLFLPIPDTRSMGDWSGVWGGVVIIAFGQFGSATLMLVGIGISFKNQIKGFTLAIAGSWCSMPFCLFNPSPYGDATFPFYSMPFVCLLMTLTGSSVCLISSTIHWKSISGRISAHFSSFYTILPSFAKIISLMFAAYGTWTFFWNIVYLPLKIIPPEFVVSILIDRACWSIDIILIINATFVLTLGMNNFSDRVKENIESSTVEKSDMVYYQQGRIMCAISTILAVIVINLIPDSILGHFSWSDLRNFSFITFLGIIMVGLGIITFLTSAYQIAKIKAINAKSLVRTGNYAIIRHPQMLGLFLVVFSPGMLGPLMIGELVSLIIFVFLEIMVLSNEERELEQKFGISYTTYQDRTNFMFSLIPPCVGKKIQALILPWKNKGKAIVEFILVIVGIILLVSVLPTNVIN